MRSSAVTMLEICGFVTVFSVVTGALQAAGAGFPLLLGALEAAVALTHLTVLSHVAARSPALADP